MNETIMHDAEHEIKLCTSSYMAYTYITNEARTIHGISVSVVSDGGVMDRSNPLYILWDNGHPIAKCSRNVSCNGSPIWTAGENPAKRTDNLIENPVCVYPTQGMDIVPPETLTLYSIKFPFFNPDHPEELLRFIDFGRDTSFSLRRK